MRCYFFFFDEKKNSPSYLFRNTCLNNTFRSFDTTWLRKIYATDASNWSQLPETADLDIFTYKGLLIPFSAEERTTLFVVLGAQNIRSYHKRNFKGDCPCILEINPCTDWILCHNSNGVADKIRAWLNRLWQDKNDSSDPNTIPFNKRSMPLHTPSGKAIYS